MAVDNRTEIDDCDAVGNWTGDTSPALNTDLQYEGTGCLQVQATNSFREWYEDSISPALNLTSCTIYFLVKAGNPETKANGGIRLIIGDGTNRRAYYIGGNDDYGLPVKGGWSAFRLDTANLPTSYSQQDGAAAPNLAAITQVGVGVLQPSKAVGNSPNTFLDRIAYVANGSPAFKVNAGTSGTPKTFTNLVGDDETNGWGFFNNPIAGSKQYGIYGAVEWGDSAAVASYFEDSNAQIYFIGTGLSTGTMDQDLLANAGVTNSLVLDNCVIVAVGAIPNWNFNITNHNILKVMNSQFAGHGTFSCPVNNANKYITDTIFNNCKKVSINTMKFEDNKFLNSTDTGGAMLFPSDDSYVKNLIFNNNNNGVEYDASSDNSSPKFDNFVFDDVSGKYDVNNTSGSSAAINQINDANGNSYNPGGSTVTFPNTKTLKVTCKNEVGNAIQGVKIRIENDPSGVLISQGVTNSSGIYQDSTYNYSGDENVKVIARLKGYKNNFAFDTITTNGLGVTFTMVFDPTVNLP